MRGDSFFLWAPVVIISLIPIIAVISWIYDKLTRSRRYNVINTYLIKKETPLTYVSYRHTKIDISITTVDTFSIQKVVNLYSASNGHFLEIISDTLINQELTVADKDIFVIKLKDDAENTKMISYALKYLTQDQRNMLQNLKRGESIPIGSLTADLLAEDAKQTAILVNNFL